MQGGGLLPPAPLSNSTAINISCATTASERGGCAVSAALVGRVRSEDTASSRVCDRRCKEETASLHS